MLVRGVCGIYVVCPLSDTRYMVCGTWCSEARGMWSVVRRGTRHLEYGAYAVRTRYPVCGTWCVCAVTFHPSGTPGGLGDGKGRLQHLPMLR